MLSLLPEGNHYVYSELNSLLNPAVTCIVLFLLRTPSTILMCALSLSVSLYLSLSPLLSTTQIHSVEQYYMYITIILYHIIKVTLWHYRIQSSILRAEDFELESPRFDFWLSYLINSLLIRQVLECPRVQFLNIKQNK